MKRALYLLIPAAFMLAIMAPGCYTVVMHPSDEGGYHAEQTSDCVRCHTDYHEYPYGYYYSPYPSYWWDYSDYAYYYAYPWWWSYYDYPYLPGDYHYSGTSGGTKFDRREGPREPAAPPYSTRSKDDYQPDDYLQPGYYDHSTGQMQPTTPSTGTPRTQPSSTDDGSHADDPPPTKIERTSRQDTKTDSGSSAGQNDTGRDQRSTDKPKEDTSKKKSRRDGGGR